MNTFMFIFNAVSALFIGILLIISGMVLSPTDQFHIRKLLSSKK